MLLQRMKRWIASHWARPVCARLKSGQCMYVDMRSRIGQGIYVTGEFDAAVFAPIPAALSRGGTMIDVGANVGYYTVLALDCIGENGQVHAFEIDPRPLKCLRRTKEKFQLKQISIHEVAVGGTCGVVYLNQEAECGNSHISPHQINGLPVEMTTLDFWAKSNPLTRLDVIKVDVEGVELDVLQGARELIRKFRPLIVVEADAAHQARGGSSVEELQLFLQAEGYSSEFLPGCWTETLVAQHITAQ
jgi:FkbM family methyltransferase